MPRGFYIHMGDNLTLGNPCQFSHHYYLLETRRKAELPATRVAAHRLRVASAG